MFAYAQVEFEEHRIKFPDDWPAQKQSLLSLKQLKNLFDQLIFPIVADYPSGQVPALEVDGRMLTQSHAIGRYLAKKFGTIWLGVEFICRSQYTNKCKKKLFSFKNY